MTQTEKRVWMIKALLAEGNHRNVVIPDDEQEQKNTLRALMNVRPPRPISDEFLKIQDEYLTVENAKRGIFDAKEFPCCASDERMCIWQGDITTIKADAIVNAANSGMTGCYAPLHNCIDNCIHTYAGVQLRLKCFEIIKAQGHEEETGLAKITPGYNLPAKYVLHTVGPIVQGPLTTEHERLLASCYTSCMDLAAENGVQSIAFCCISTGVFMFPKERAAQIAVETVRNWLDENGSHMKIIFNVFSNSDRMIYENILN